MSKNILFQIHTYKDFPLLLKCLRTFRKFYPLTIFQIISDGPYMTETQKQKLEEVRPYAFFEGERLMGLDHGTAWIERRLRMFLLTDMDVCIKIDPDTRCWREFLYVPDADYFGTVVTKSKTVPSYVQGGCKGISRRITQKLIDDKRFDVAEEWRMANEYAMYSRIRSGNALITEDLITAVILKKYYDTQFLDWDEVHCTLDDRNPLKLPINPLINGIPRYAVTHPHKA